MAASETAGLLLTEYLSFLSARSVAAATEGTAGAAALGACSDGSPPTSAPLLFVLDLSPDPRQAPSPQPRQTYSEVQDAVICRMVHSTHQ